MTLGVLLSAALVLAAPLAAGAASPSVRYSVTLNGTIVDAVSYDQTRQAGEECRVQREGTGRRSLVAKTLRPVTIAVSRSGKRVVYRPSRLAVRLTGTAGKGSYDEKRVCRAAPVVRKHADCRAERLAARRLRTAFRRPSRNRIAFAASPQTEQVGACGLDRLVAGGWLDHALGRVDEAALLNGRARRVLARGSSTTTALIGDPLGGKISRRSTVRWTLTFRRL